MLELTSRHHAAYCAKHGLVYWPVIGDVQFSRPPHWNKIVLIRHALACGFDLVVWLDADTLIVRDDVDVRTALGDGPPLGMARHPISESSSTDGHSNSGVMILRNTPRVQEFFHEVWTAGPLSNHPWMEQARIHDRLKNFPGLLQRLDDRWNSTFEVNESSAPVIKAWHGLGARAVTPIYDELKQLGALDGRARQLAATFVHSDNVRERTARAIASPPPFPDTFRGRGIVMCAGGVGYFTCAWVCVHQLRRLGCTLPIQMWHLGPGEMDAHMRSLVAPLGVECVDAHGVRRAEGGRLFRGCEVKPFAILRSPFREVLFLDADNVPVVNPEFLFDTPEFRETGAIFWPDLFRMKPEHSAWSAFGVPYRDEPEFETGQIVLDKERGWRALNLTLWFNENPEFFRFHALGDKDTFRFAWHRLHQRFAMPPFPVQRLAGTMCQHDFTGRRVFQHRNTDKWNPFCENQRVEGFLFEEECREDLRRLREVWDGKIENSKSQTPNAESGNSKSQTPNSK